MPRPILRRTIPCLLLRDNGLVKTEKFKKDTYIGDPLNAVKIFNEKEVDELVFLDIDATKKGKEPHYSFIQDIANECFMPFCYGGGIKSIEQIKKIIASGAEKVSINTAAFTNPELITEAANIFGSSTIVVSIDVKKDLFGKKRVYVSSGKKNTKMDPVVYSKKMEALGAGEILLNSVDKDGTMTGYDLDLIKSVSEAVSIPVIACGGVGTINHFSLAIKQAKASAVAAGSFFVYQGPRKAVLISYPSQQELKEIYQ
ncbi:AglZ/HisF2 family acetamidino modification protein [Pseudofulvibacter geojedonensis]|uniref:imidazole glycerol-phosphate synthase n=1 Tax=Pseudofulvibacter geojedonensis TaxID=1123758 RepID=A0ABW3I469_9FLAO